MTATSALAGGPPQPSFYVDGTLYRTIGTPTDLSQTGAPAHSFDTIYEFFGNQRNVATAAPGDWTTVAKTAEGKMRSKLVGETSTGREVTGSFTPKRFVEKNGKVLAKGLALEPAEAEALAESLFAQVLPAAWDPVEAARNASPGDRPIPLPVWDDLWRCFAVARLGGPSPAEPVLGIPANTLRQSINDRESR